MPLTASVSRTTLIVVFYLTSSLARAEWKSLGDVVAGLKVMQSRNCDEFLVPRYSIFPMHRKLRLVRNQLVDQLKVNSISISLPPENSVLTVKIQSKYGHYTVKFQVETRQTKLVYIENESSSSLKSRTEGTVLQDFESKEQMIGNFLQLATSVAIPAVFPFKQDVIVEISGPLLLSPVDHHHDLKFILSSVPTIKSFFNLGFSLHILPPTFTENSELSLDLKDYARIKDKTYFVTLGFNPQSAPYRDRADDL